MAFRIDETGNKYNHLTFLSHAGAGSVGRGTMWIVQCDCGRVKEIHRMDVIKGKSKTCGKLGCPFLKKLRTTKPYRDRKARERGHYRKFIKGLSNRNQLCRLHADQFFHLIVQPCTLCGTDPDPYGTVERRDVSREYTEENTIPVCKLCRRHMNGRSLADYLSHIQKTIVHLTHHNQSSTQSSSYSA